MNKSYAFRALTSLLAWVILYPFSPASAQRNQWQPDSTAYEYLSKGENVAAFRSNRLSEIAVDSLRFKNNPHSIRWTIPPNSGTAILTFNLGDRDLRNQSLYFVCSRNNNINTLTCFVNTASGGKYRIGPVVKTNAIGFHLPVDDWHQTGQFLAGTFSNPATVADLEHTTSITFEASNSGDESILWIDEIRMIRPRGPVAAINFNRYRDQADTSLTPYLLQKGIKANIDFVHSFAREQKLETYNAIPFRSVGLGRIDTLVNQYGWSCSSHGSYYDQMTYLSPQSRYELFALDSFVASGFDARWCFAIPQDKVTPPIMKEIWDYGQYRSIRRQGQDIQNLPVSNPLDLGFFRPTSRLAGPNLNGNPLLLEEMKTFVDSCVRHKGLILLDFGTLVYSPSPLYTDVETTLMSDATALIEYVDSLGLPFLSFEDLFGDDTAYVSSLTTGDDYLVLQGLSPQDLPILQNDVWGPGAILQMQLQTLPQHGTVSLNGTQVIYTPDSTCFDTDTLTYILGDGVRSDTALVRILRMQNRFIGEKTFHCSPTRFDVEAIVSGGVSPYSYAWSNGSTVQSLNLQGGATYLLTVTDSLGCTLTDSITLTNRIKPAPVTTNSLQCGPGIPTCSAFAQAGTLLWYADSLSTVPLQQGGNTFSGIIDSTTALYVSVDYGTCSSIRIPVTVTVEKPSVSLVLETDTVGCGDAVYIVRAETGPGLLYQWKRNGNIVPNAIDSRLVTGLPGIYTVEVTRPEDSCVTVSQPVRFRVINSASITAGNTTLCIGDSILLSTTNSTFFDYTWHRNGFPITNSNVASLWISTPGDYTVEIDGPGSCLLTSAPLSIVNSGTATIDSTTASSCDSYTWAVNGNTYTQSGFYTSTDGCDTEILNLTVTVSTSATVADSACDSYTWAVNGNTYTQSGNYTSTNGCDTEILNLTVTASTSTTVADSACDSYTWAVNGNTYTQSGSYTSSAGCNTEILDLLIIASTSASVADTACDSYTWTVNGNTYTQSGTYTSVDGCATEILQLDIIATGGSSSNVTAIDSFFWSINGTTYTQSGIYTNIEGCQYDTLILTISPSTGVSDMDNGFGFILKPNPASETLELTWRQDMSAHQLKIVDAFGKTIEVISLENTQSKLRIDVSHLPTVLYIALLENNENRLCIRWMKE